MVRVVDHSVFYSQSAVVMVYRLGFRVKGLGVGVYGVG
jgi:hypothetical protein